MSQMSVVSQGPLRGQVQVPGDKSISHRTLLLGMLADGDSHVRGFLPSADCLATLRCAQALGIAVERPSPTTLVIHGRGLQGLQAPNAPLDCARSGTTMRLLTGTLAGQPFSSLLTGDPQLLRRPMERIAGPLRRMGAEIETTDGHAPLTIHGRRLHGCAHTLPIASAQVKSAILLAGLYADGTTIVRQPGPARDHTERMLAAMGADITVTGLTVTLSPPPALHRDCGRVLRNANSQSPSGDASHTTEFKPGGALHRDCGRVLQNANSQSPSGDASHSTEFKSGDASHTTRVKPGDASHAAKLAPAHSHTFPLSPLDLTVPGDLSSAAFPLVAALLMPGSDVTIKGVGVNPTRTGLLDVLQAMNASIAIANRRDQGGEPVADVTAQASALRGAEVSGTTVVRMIDEFPVLAVAATQAKGETIVRDAAELRVKETDRIAAIASELRKLGARIEPQPDGFVVEGPTTLRGTVVDSHGDHRVAMALAVAGLIAEGETTIRHTECIADSFPTFVEVMQGLGGVIA